MPFMTVDILEAQIVELCITGNETMETCVLVNI